MNHNQSRPVRLPACPTWCQRSRRHPPRLLPNPPTTGNHANDKTNLHIGLALFLFAAFIFRLQVHGDINPLCPVALISRHIRIAAVDHRTVINKRRPRPAGSQRGQGNRRNGGGQQRTISFRGHQTWLLLIKDKSGCGQIRSVAGRSGWSQHALCDSCIFLNSEAPYPGPT